MAGKSILEGELQTGPKIPRNEKGLVAWTARIAPDQGAGG